MIGKENKILAITLFILGGILLFSLFLPRLGTLFWDDLANLYSKIFNELPEIKKGLTGLAEKVEKQIATPPPLRAEEETAKSFLTEAGVIAWTNVQREKYGLSKLTASAKLAESAGLKTAEMLENQYFAHTSPSGQTVGNLAYEVGYEFIAIGENLALGNFENDEVLVRAWMDSPGHRANILNNRYREIGVAVLKGVFEGKMTWLAVQHFGLPLSVCPEPRESIKLTIIANQKQLDEIAAKLAALEAEIKLSRPRRRPEYQQKIEEYSQMVAQYNLLVGQTQAIIDDYNAQVRTFNECLSGI